MTQYDFKTVPNRLKTHSVKWKAVEQNSELLPMWVADMDFLALPEIKEAIKSYADYGVYGYAYTNQSLLDSIAKWEEKQHGYPIQTDMIRLVSGVVPTLSLAIQALTQKGDAVMISTPVYPPFARTVKLNERHLVENSLKEANGHFEFDFKAFEEAIVDENVRLYVLCNPHNPGGRVWTKEEVQKVGEICQKHGVYVLSDEIHQDLTLFGHKHYSFNTVDPSFADFSIIASSATKTFNIAGTKNSFAIIENKTIRDKFDRKRLANNQHEVSTLGMLATEVAYQKGENWLSELKVQLEKNINYVVDYFAKEAPKIKVMKPEGTYLIWLDFTDYRLTDQALHERLQKEAKVILNQGSSFGWEGNHHARLNIAAPLTSVQEACKRIVSAFK